MTVKLYLYKYITPAAIFNKVNCDRLVGLIRFTSRDCQESFLARPRNFTRIKKAPPTEKTSRTCFPLLD